MYAIRSYYERNADAKRYGAKSAEQESVDGAIKYPYRSVRLFLDTFSLEWGLLWASADVPPAERRNNFV